jgi:hypothetical protein
VQFHEFLTPLLFSGTESKRDWLRPSLQSSALKTTKSYASLYFKKEASFFFEARLHNHIFVVY